jgi:3-hydroxybutyryl-CoA dehydratase
MSELNFKVGDSSSLRRTITEADIVNFAGISGDFNPVHVDEEYAKTTLFKGRIAHGLFSAALISSVLGNKLPGPGCIYLKQGLHFLSPVKIGDTIIAEVEIVEIIDGKRRMRLRTTCKNQLGKAVLDGEALVQF